MQGNAIRDRKPQLIDMPSRAGWRTQTVSCDLMSRAGEADRPDRMLLAIAHHRDDGHARKLGRIARDDRGDEKGERQDGENPGRTPPEELTIPKLQDLGGTAPDDQVRSLR